jgi:hypothetical protein
MRGPDALARAPAAEKAAAGALAIRPEALACQRCGFPIRGRAWGCKNPCANCGTVYPLGDCSD